MEKRSGIFSCLHRIQLDSVWRHTVLWLILAAPIALVGGFLSGLSIWQSVGRDTGE